MTIDFAPTDTRLAASWTPEDRRDRFVAAIEDLVPVVVAAYERRDWLNFGFDSWADYVNNMLGGLRLPRESRCITAWQLHQGGMSNRDIGAIVGASEATVRRDLAIGPYRDPDNPEADPVVPEGAAPVLIDEGATHDAPALLETVVGTDGKRYNATRPKVGAVINVEPTEDVTTPVEVVEQLSLALVFPDDEPEPPTSTEPPAEPAPAALPASSEALAKEARRIRKLVEARP